MTDGPIQGVNIVTIMRWVRAVSGIAVTWGAAFAALGTTAYLGAIAFKVLPPELASFRFLALIVVRNFVGGAVAGAFFASVFARAERNRTLATLSARRVALWGSSAPRYRRRSRSDSALPGLFRSASWARRASRTG